MSEQKHTPEPWLVSGKGSMRFIDSKVSGGLYQEVATCMRVDYGDMEANARRIVACVNACAGIGTAALESLASAGNLTIKNASCAFERVNHLERQRDQLLAALKEAATSLITISHQAGLDEYLTELSDVRGYARSRASVAYSAIAAVEEAKCKS